MGLIGFISELVVLTGIVAGVVMVRKQKGSEADAVRWVFARPREGFAFPRRRRRRSPCPSPLGWLSDGEAAVTRSP